MHLVLHINVVLRGISANTDLPVKLGRAPRSPNLFSPRLKHCLATPRFAGRSAFHSDPPGFEEYAIAPST